mmetsp:Transcript_19053/g.57568  ORF Transcript_19053/g.57568 Transcript_19053/m.57568 type:complete len:308 (-) Transcript_19053:1470-2393(-)
MGGRGMPYGGRGAPPQGPYPGGRGRSRSYSPDPAAAAKRRRSPAGSPVTTPREGRPHKRRGPPLHGGARRSKYSSSRSRSFSGTRSRSRSTSASRPHRAAPNTAPPAATANAGAAEVRGQLAEARRREGELQARVEALEAQNKATASASRAITDQLADLTATQQKNEATHKLYRRWMSALLESSQAHLEAKDEVAAAKAEYAQRGKDLMQLLTEADAFLTEERRERRKHKRSTDGPAAEPAEVGTAGAGTPVPVAASAGAPVKAEHTNGAPPLPDEGAGGWSEAPTAVEAPAPADRFAAGAKFTINT